MNKFCKSVLCVENCESDVQICRRLVDVPGVEVPGSGVGLREPGVVAPSVRSRGWKHLGAGSGAAGRAARRTC